MTANRDARRTLARGRCEAAWHPMCPELSLENVGAQGYGLVRMHAHHVQRRTKGGTDDVENLRWVCEPCHHRIHNRPDEARERGLLA